MSRKNREPELENEIPFPEMRKPDDLPFSDPSGTDEPKAGGYVGHIEDYARWLARAQAELRSIVSGTGWSGQDGDTILADVIGIKGDNEMNGMCSSLCSLFLNADCKQDVAETFRIMTGTELLTYFKLALETVERELSLVRTKTVVFTVQCMATYGATMDVPASMGRAEAAKYIAENMDKVKLGQLQYVPDSDQLDEESVKVMDDPKERFK